MINRIADYQTSTAEEKKQREEGQDRTFQHWFHWAQRQIAEHPKASLGVGVALGVALGWLIKRR
jgi:ElaB/YqjD/DUF883 family membrane-anchored ribosome-binding protein